MAGYEVYSDGACSGNPGPGGWGVIVIQPDGERRELSGFAARTTNNRMELMGVLQGLSLAPNGADVTVVSDSQYVINGACSWLDGWKRKGWKTAAGKPVKNQDLLRALDEEIGRHASVRWHWVRGHETGEAHAHKALNDRADRLAVAAAARYAAA